MIEKVAEQLVVSKAKEFLLKYNLINGIDDISAADKVDALYVHIPFCRSLCPFCIFNRQLHDPKLEDLYFPFLKKEAEIYYNQGYKFNTLYVGGGTPTVNFEHLIDTIEFLKNLYPLKEISVESTYRELDENKINELKDLGVNRLSIGIQTFDEELSKRIGRAWQHKDEALEIMSIANEKIPTLNVDLLFNFPFQTYQQFEGDIDILLESKVKQITAYPLMSSIYSQLFKNIDRKREKGFYNILIKKMKEAKYIPSTPWCFSKNKTEAIDEYTTKFDYYIGIGTSSISYVNERFYVNTFSIAKYINLLKENKIPAIIDKRIAEESIDFFLLNRLFALEIKKEDFIKKYKSAYNLNYVIILLKLFNCIKEKREKIILTERGFYLMSSSMRAFLSVLDTLREELRKSQY